MDIALIWNPDTQTADLKVDGNDLVLDESLETSAILSICLDRQAEPDDDIPDGTTDRRGWWGDAVPVVEGDKIGSRLWLLDRSKNTPTVLRRAEEYCREALQWMLDDRLASAISAASESAFGGQGRLDTVVIDRPGADPITLRFHRAWEAQAARR